MDAETLVVRSLAEYFADWESHAFGFGYGTGEEHTIPALKQFMATCPAEGGYDFRDLEMTLTPVVAWLMINALCRVGVLEYGSSPRFGWLTSAGLRLREFVLDHPADELCAMTALETDGCAPDCCNCGPNGYEEGHLCPNPFWQRGAGYR